jgi:hypothetical protein
MLFVNLGFRVRFVFFKPAFRRIRHEVIVDISIPYLLQDQHKISLNLVMINGSVCSRLFSILLVEHRMGRALLPTFVIDLCIPTLQGPYRKMAVPYHKRILALDSCIAKPASLNGDYVVADAHFPPGPLF